MAAPPEEPGIRHPRVVAGLVVVAVALGLVIWLLVRDGGEGPSSAVTTPAPPSAPPASPGTDVTPGTGRTVQVRPRRTAAPVPLGATASYANGVTVRLTDVTAVQGQATLPGEVSGPSLRVALEVRNGSPHTIDLGRAMVAAYSGPDRRPALPLSDGTAPLSGEVSPGEARDGVYVFNVPTAERSTFRVEFTYRAEAVTVVFRGKAP